MNEMRSNDFSNLQLYDQIFFEIYISFMINKRACVKSFVLFLLATLVRIITLGTLVYRIDVQYEINVQVGRFLKKH